MVDKLNRKLTLIIGGLTVAVIALLLLPFRLGLDLQGGTRLRYSVDLEKARAEGMIPADKAAYPDQFALQEIMAVWRKRVDPQGVRGVKLRSEGSNAIVVELPASANLVATKATSTVTLPNIVPAAEGVPASIGATLFDASGFPKSGRIEVGGATWRYDDLLGNELRRIEIIEGNANPADVFVAGAEVKLEASDPWRALIENTGRMEILMKAYSEDLDVEGVAVADLDAELEKAREWSRANPNASIADYNSLIRDENQGSPIGRLRFFPYEEDEGNKDQAFADRLDALILEEDPDQQFSGSTFTRVYPTYDRQNRPAVGFDIDVPRHNDFGKFTSAHLEKQMAIVVDGEIVTAPNLNVELTRGGIIEGGAFGFKQEEVNELVRAINSGSLNVEPRFEDRETVGASLGAEYVKTGTFSVIAGLLAVLVFVALYYRRLGTYAAVSLMFNLVLLMGAMAMLQATLTLPGVAGIILTVGMAVDANILIYERIREEQLRGRRPAQSAKDGFANALSTIVDANLTTLITAVILYKFGSGPVRGFATTLIVGILTSMFSALVFTRVMVHFALEKGVESWSMMRLVSETKIGFMRIARKTAFASLAVIVGGVAFFSTLPKASKYSIDFLGGISMEIVTAKSEKQETVVAKLAELGGVFEDAQVQSLLSSAEGDGYRKFQIEFKAETTEASEESKRYRAQVEEQLADILAPTVATFESTGEGGASGTIYFEDSHPAADVDAILDTANMGGDVTVTALVGTADAASTFSFTAPATEPENVLRDRISTAFAYKKDSAQRDFNLAQPVPQSSAVGPQVVQELRDDAILAILLSLFAVVLYIRVRFAEYSYGFAAVIALVHDVLVTLGALAIAIQLNIINAQVSLVMIAAFLTIIGYSLNDTIVVFDRIRENLRPLGGKKPLSEIIDLSINQTLARTVLTSLTTLITVLILFVFNFGTRNELEGFAYAVIIGVFVGTYSSMFVASPALLWLETRRQARNPESDDDAGAVAVTPAGAEA